MQNSGVFAPVSDARKRFVLFLLLLGVMLISRGHHMGSAKLLPDMSIALFFLSGWLLARPIYAALLMLAAVGIDVSALQAGVSNFCVTPAYALLAPAYLTMWGAGKHLPGLLMGRSQGMALALLALGAWAAVSVAWLLSSGGFYLFSGRFSHPSWAEFAHRFELYYGGYAGNALLAIAVGVTGVILLRRLRQPQEEELCLDEEETA
ncbi:hypothetical protein MAIT1_03906 [Magnetofaba australis IT-1]|uniref:Proton-coupled thiamine transporter YuaJ n=2 Tax=Magnetofaba TaxID=1472292 RepID=A0A1Y2K8U0_9PROT|nr:hypothetical protein MAIT1_03906 [Magnetofaba australis IT-1]